MPGAVPSLTQSSRTVDCVFGGEYEPGAGPGARVGIRRTHRIRPAGVRGVELLVEVGDPAVPALDQGSIPVPSEDWRAAANSSRPPPPAAPSVLSARARALNSLGAGFLPAPILQRVLVTSTSRCQRSRHHHSTAELLGHTPEYRSTGGSHYPSM